MISVSADLINPFVSATVSVIAMLLGEEPIKGDIAGQRSCFSSEQVNVVLGVTGDANGAVILGLSFQTADRIASAMIGSPVKSFDSMAASAIAELGNMIAGNALTLLADNGYVCDLAPPTLFRGTKIKISTWNEPAIVVPFQVNRGSISLTLSLKRNESARAA